jgi:hypothetical protein
MDPAEAELQENLYPQSGYSGLTSYMLRTTQQHHVQLSAMADVKASIIMTAASIILTMVLGLLIDNGARVSLIVLGGFVVVALLLAVFAVIPRYRPAPVVDADEPWPQSLNILFFGHFSGIPAERFMDEVEQISKSSEALIRTQAKDIWQLGTYLEAGKYRYLRFSYAAFAAGIAIAGIVELVNQAL